MSEQKETPRRLTRKDFVRGAAALAGAGALASCAPAAAPAETPAPAPTCPPTEECAPCPTPWLPEKWDVEADVVVVGYGGAGAVAAITASDLGAEVVVLEKVAFEGGGSSRMSSWNVLYTENPTEAAKALNAASLGSTPMDVCQAWAEGLTKTIGWFDTMGIPTNPPSGPPAGEFSGGLVGEDALMSFNVVGKGVAWFEAIDPLVTERGIEVLLDTPAKELVQDWQTKEILGVIAESQGQEVAVKARRGVVLCTGGFGYDEEMVSNYLPAVPFHFYSAPSCTGDGTKMAQKVGADLWHMNGFGSRGCMWFPEHPIAFTFRGAPANGYIFVDGHGTRYGNEKAVWMGHSWGHLMVLPDYDAVKDGAQTIPFARIPSYCIFDETTQKAGPLGRKNGSGSNAMPPELGGATWSDDNSEEIAKGWIKKADTIEGLAQMIDIVPSVLKAQIDVWNQYSVDGQDTAFNRDPTTLVPIETPPFYAVALWPSGVGPHGGPRRNAKGQVVDLDRNPIPRLYAAGVEGTVMGFNYVNAGACTDVIVFGQISGENAAAEEPWA